MKKHPNKLQPHAPRALHKPELEVIRGGTSEVKSDRDTIVSSDLSQEINRNLK